MSTFKRQFKGVCRNCNQCGHKAVDCPTSPSKGGGGPPKTGKGYKGGWKPNLDHIKHFRCNLKGHHARDCPQHQEGQQTGMFVGVCELASDEVPNPRHCCECPAPGVCWNKDRWRWVNIPFGCCHSPAHFAETLEGDIHLKEEIPNEERIFDLSAEDDSESMDTDDDMPPLTQRDEVSSSDSDSDMPELVEEHCRLHFWRQHC